MKNTPYFEDWLMTQEYDTLLWEYQELLIDILGRQRNGDNLNKYRIQNMYNKLKM